MARGEAPRFERFQIDDRPALALMGEPALREDRVYLSFSGDLGFKPGHVLPADLGPFLEADARLLERFDLNVVNLEFMFTGAAEADGLAESVLRGAGFDVVAVANNHALDGGLATLDATVARLEALGARVVGTPRRDVFEYRAGALRVALYALTHFTDESIEGQADDEGVLVIDAERLATLEERTRDHDLRIAFLHLGSLSSFPSPHEQALVAQAIATGADLVVCSGAHFVKGFLEVQGKPVVYGTGNYLFSYKGDNTEPIGMHFVVGIGETGVEQMLAVPFGGDWRGGPLGPLDEAQFETFQTALQTRSDPEAGDYFSDDRTANLFWSSLANLSFDKLGNLRPRHFAYAVRILWSRYPLPLLVGLVGALAFTAWWVRRRRSAPSGT